MNFILYTIVTKVSKDNKGTIAGIISGTVVETGNRYKQKISQFKRKRVRPLWI